MTTILALLVGDVLEKLCDSCVSILHPHHSGLDRLLGLESFVDQEDACLAGIDVFLVFGVGIEAELSAASVFNLCEGSGECFGISIDCPVEYSRQLFSCQFHKNGYSNHKVTTNKQVNFDFGWELIIFAVVNEIGAARFLSFILEKIWIENSFTVLWKVLSPSGAALLSI